MVMLRPRGKASRIYKKIFALEEKSPEKGTDGNSKNKKMNILHSKDYSLNPRARNP